MSIELRQRPVRNWDSFEYEAVIHYVRGRRAEGLMRPRERRESGEQVLFRSWLDQVIDWITRW